LILNFVVLGKKVEQAKGKKKQPPPTADIPVKHRNVVDEDFTLARLRKLPISKYLKFYLVTKIYKIFLLSSKK